MELKDQLLPGSFRGVPFHVIASPISAGRRVQLHEYPQRDKPYVEDLGRATREIEISAVLVGKDYIAQANALLAAFEAPGNGKLIHPWLGEMQVALNGKAKVDFDPGLGKAVIEASFIEAGELVFPAAVASTQAVARQAASALQEASIASFTENFSIKGFQDFVQAVAQGNLAKVLGVAVVGDFAKTLGIATQLAKSVSTLVALVFTPGNLATRLFGLFGLSGIATTVASWRSIVKSLVSLGKSKNLVSPPAATAFYPTPSRRQADKNAIAIHQLMRQALLVQAIGASTLVNTGVDADASPTAPYVDVLALRDDLVAWIDAELLEASDAVYFALHTCRAAVWRDLTTRARDNARIVLYTPPAVLPTLVVAHLVHADATREAEIVARNSLLRPGFVPVKPLNVLTR